MAKSRPNRVVAGWFCLGSLCGIRNLGRGWFALHLANRRALSTSSSRQSILGRHAPLFSCSKYVHFYGRLTAYLLYSFPYTLSNSSCFIDTSSKLKLPSNACFPAPDTDQILLNLPSKSRGQVVEAFQTFLYDADYATCHGHSTSSTPNCQCG